LVVGALAVLPAVGALAVLPAVGAVPTLVLDPATVVVVVLVGVLDVALPLVVAWLATRRDAPRAPIGLAMAATLASVSLVASLGEAVTALADPSHHASAFGVPLLGTPLVGAIVPLVLLLAAVHTVRVRDDPRRMRLATWPTVTAAALVVWALTVAGPVAARALGLLPALQQPTGPPAASGAGGLIGLAGLGVIAWFVGRTRTLLVVPAAVVVTVIVVFASLANAATTLLDDVALAGAAGAIPVSLTGPAVIAQLAAAAVLTAATARLTVAARGAWRQLLGP
jgi:hypothetical protein